jgi:hypothetical protein
MDWSVGSSASSSTLMSAASDMAGRGDWSSFRGGGGNRWCVSVCGPFECLTAGVLVISPLSEVVCGGYLGSSTYCRVWQWQWQWKFGGCRRCIAGVSQVYRRCIAGVLQCVMC